MKLNKLKDGIKLTQAEHNYLLRLLPQVLSTYERIKQKNDFTDDMPGDSIMHEYRINTEIEIANKLIKKLERITE